MLRLIRCGYAAFNPIRGIRRSWCTSNGARRNRIAGTECSAIIDRSRPGVIGHERQPMCRAQVKRRLQCVVAGVSRIAEAVADALEREWLQSDIELLGRSEVSRAREACTVGRL